MPEQFAAGFGPDVLALQDGGPEEPNNASGQRTQMIEIVSPGNKSTSHAFRTFLDKAAQLLDRRVHLLVAGLLSHGRRDPMGLRAGPCEVIEEDRGNNEKPITMAAYEAGLRIRAFVRTVAIDESLPEMPFSVAADACVQVPLDFTYQTAFAAQSLRWRHVLEVTA